MLTFLLDKLNTRKQKVRFTIERLVTLLPFVDVCEIDYHLYIGAPTQWGFELTETYDIDNCLAIDMCNGCIRAIRKKGNMVLLERTTSTNT